MDYIFGWPLHDDGIVIDIYFYSHVQMDRLVWDRSLGRNNALFFMDHDELLHCLRKGVVILSVGQ